MKKIIMFICCLILLTSLVFAESETQIGVSVTTSQNIDSLIVENSPGSIDNTIICNGGVCNTNVQGGNVNIPEGQTFNYNSYVTKTGGGGLGISDFVNNLGKSSIDYNKGAKIFGVDYWYDLWGLLDSVFVSHKEYQATYSNVLYLADEIDKLKTENEMLREYLNVTLNPTAVECRTAFVKAERIKSRVITVNGWIADPSVYVDKCIKVNEVNSTLIGNWSVQ